MQADADRAVMSTVKETRTDIKFLGSISILNPVLQF